jgi:hypothetical protein
MQPINVQDLKGRFLSAKFFSHPKRIKASLLSILVALTLTSCGTSGQQLGTDTTLACTMFVNPDEYRVGVLMILGSGGDAYSYINTSVRELKYPGATDTLETQNIKNQWATALEDFVFAYNENDRTLESSASENLDWVAKSLKNRCVEIGMDYSGLS